MYKQILTFLLLLVLPIVNAKVKVSNKQQSPPLFSKHEKQVDSLMSLMTLDEKIGQMTQVDLYALSDTNDITKYFIGSVLSGGDSDPSSNSAEEWADNYDHIQSYALKTKLKIPIIYGIDAVHGHNNVLGAVIFPHNIGLGCTRNPELVEEAARVTAEEVAATGIDWAFAPCVAVARNEKWGRTYESFGETPELVSEMGEAEVKGFQTDNLAGLTSILACAKHYLGDGGTTNGKDQGNTQCNEQTLRKLFLPPYQAAIKAGVGSIMVSYSSWNGEKMSENKYLLTDVLKKELGFRGFLVSDWAAIDQLGPNYKSDIEKSINAGLDMIMIPNGPGKKNNFIEFINDLKNLVKENKVSISRINDAVRRILRVKFEMGIFEHPYTDRSLLKTVGSKKHRQVARECVRQSLVLLKNDNKTLPLSKNLKKIFVAGKSADNIGNQCGGWTISWQGESGNVTTGGTTILQAIKQAVGSETQVVYSKDGSGTKGADVGIVVVGETPYAEGRGDSNDLSLSKEDEETIQKVKESGTPTVVILISGRPMIINKALKNCDAFIAAWLPGTEGEGVADVIFGDYNPTGKLSRSWPRSNLQIPINFGNLNYNPLFPYGYGLTY
jgi:beta-glucosidase